MENASKALLMAAGIIIGVLILTVAVVLFAIFGNYNKDIINEFERTKITEYNNSFYKYYGINITAHDVITMANFAKKANNDVGLEGITTASDSSDYIQIVLKYYKNNGSNLTTENNFENKTEKEYNNFLKSKSAITKISGGEEVLEIINYKCTNIVTNKNSKKVIKVEIEEIKN